MSVVLVDQDGVIADWGHGYGQSLDRYGDVAANIPRHRDQLSFDLHAGRTPDEVDIIKAVMVEEGFYSQLRPIPGAKQALKAMLNAGHDVRIVTSPWVSNPTCASDKLNWIVKHYGSHWGARVIITSDKTLVRGDYLIDDKPEVKGSQVPTWEHVYFTQPYNATLEGRRRITNWNEWEAIVNG
jgi:5'-nucleotidase